MSRATYNAKELAEVLGVSESLAYRYIRQMNDELAQNGFIIIRGRIPKVYAEKRFFGGIMQATEGVANG